MIDLLNTGSSRKLTLISAPAGFGKSTLLSAWVHLGDQVHPSSFRPHPSKVAWLSLDAGDNDLTRFLSYFIAALQRVGDEFGKSALVALQSPGDVNTEVILTTLLNEIAEFPENLMFVLDDYHVIESQPIDRAITFIIEHLPTPLHLVIASRIDPTLPLSRLRARGEMTEIRANDLRFTLEE
ncbi:MAG: LuxR family transcriptional regulator, partial [Chloroflexi bacterium]|nr:LuxR family transcriptional regulator [Chloroflexota bacterium]